MAYKCAGHRSVGDTMPVSTGQLTGYLTTRRESRRSRRHQNCVLVARQTQSGDREWIRQVLHRPRSDADGDMYVASRHSMTYTEAVSPPTQLRNIGTPRPRTFETPSRTAVVSRSRYLRVLCWDRSNGGVALPSARHADESSTSKYPTSAVRCRGKPRRLRRGGGHVGTNVEVRLGVR